MSQPKTIDSKGRLTLGPKFAGRMVEIDEGDGTVTLKFVKTVPEREAWLWESDTALSRVQAGLAQAAAGDLSDGPDLSATRALADDIPDDE